MSGKLIEFCKDMYFEQDKFKVTFEPVTSGHRRRSPVGGGEERGRHVPPPPIFLMGPCSNRLTIIVGCVLFPLFPTTLMRNHCCCLRVNLLSHLALCLGSPDFVNILVWGRSSEVRKRQSGEKLEENISFLYHLIK